VTKHLLNLNRPVIALLVRLLLLPLSLPLL